MRAPSIGIRILMASARLNPVGRANAIFFRGLPTVQPSSVPRGSPAARASASAALCLSIARRTSFTSGRNGSGGGVPMAVTVIPWAWLLGPSGPIARRWPAGFAVRAHAEMGLAHVVRLTLRRIDWCA
jgi:hypothetical protein